MPDFTDQFIEGLQPDGARYDVYERDNFLISVMPNGLKTWVYLQNVKGQQRQTLGVYPEMTLQDARTAWTKLVQINENMGNPGGALMEERMAKNDSLSYTPRKQPLADVVISKVGRTRRLLLVTSALVASALGSVLLGARIEYDQLLKPLIEQSVIKQFSLDGKTNSITHNLSAANPSFPTPAETRLSERNSRADLVALAMHEGQNSDTSANQKTPIPLHGLTPQVARAQFTNGIEEREPIDELGPTIYTQGQAVRQLYFFTDVRGMNGQTVTHRWQHEGQVVAEVSFDISGERWRVFSSKNLLPTMIGQWEVIVMDPSDTPIYMSSFFYQNPKGETQEFTPTVEPATQQKGNSMQASSQRAAEDLYP